MVGLEEGKASGELDATIPTSVMLSAFLGLLSPRSHERLIVGESLSPAELARIHFNVSAAR